MAAPDPPKDPWDHEKATKIFDGTDTSSKVTKAKAILHAKQMAALVEELEDLTHPGRTPSPREALIRSWTEVVAALSVERKSRTVLGNADLPAALEGLRAAREEIEATIKQFKGLPSASASGSLQSPQGSGSVQFASLVPDGPGHAPSGAAGGKGKDIVEGAEDNIVLDLLKSELGKRGPEAIEESKLQAPPLRTPGVPIKVPAMPGNYATFVALCAQRVCVQVHAMHAPELYPRVQ